MNVQPRMDFARSWAPWVVALIVASFAGCMGVGELSIYEERPIAFSHKVHTEKAQLTCVECHMGAQTEASAGMPSPRACKLCHESKEDFDAKLKPFLVEGKVTWTDATDLIEDVSFDHQKHADAQVSCETCHKGIQTSEKVSANLAVAKQACLQCHAGKAQVDTCGTCHATLDQSFKPETHQVGWIQLHGGVAQAGHVPPYVNNCAMCHSEASCQQCHADQEPDNHTNFWRLQGHGVTAAMDRASCETCHRSDFCTECHVTTQPKTHISSWGGSQDFHCMSCHVGGGGRDEGCAVCHTGGSNHAEAQPQPDWHGSDMDCRQCHGVGAPLPHPDNGDSCAACHL